MTLIDKEQIRAEIERHRQAIRVLNEHTAPEQMSKTCAIFQYSDSILSELLSILNTLPEQPHEGQKDDLGGLISEASKVAKRLTDMNSFYASLPESLRYEYPIEKWEEILKAISAMNWQEQPVEKTCKTCGFYENNCPYIRDKFIPYPNKVCKDYTYSVMKAQEQPVEGLEVHSGARGDGGSNPPAGTKTNF